MRLHARYRHGDGHGGNGHDENERRPGQNWVDNLFNYNPSRDDNEDDPLGLFDADDPNDPEDDLFDPDTDCSDGEEDPRCSAQSTDAGPEPTPSPNPPEPTQNPVPTDPQQQNDPSLHPSDTDVASETSTPAHSTNTTPSPSTFTSSVSHSPFPTAPPEMGPPTIPEGPGEGKDFKLKTGHIAAAILIPLLFIILITIFVFLFLKRRRRRRQQHNDSRIHNLGTSREMRFSKMTGYSPVVHTMEQLPLPPPPTMSGAHLAPIPPQPEITNVPAIPYARPPSTQPIILGPMNQSNTGNYYTGLDADTLSISESTTQRNGAYAMTEDPDEPPPPYRPRSVMTISREPSTRQQIHSIAESDESRRNLLPEYIPPSSRSPFEDPDPDDDAVSDISEPSQRHSLRRGHDVMSAVSDLSYQNIMRRP